MSAKRREQRYVLDQGLPCDTQLGMIDLSPQDVVRLLNAGERSKVEKLELKAEVRRLKAELGHVKGILHCCGSPDGCGKCEG